MKKYLSGSWAVFKNYLFSMIFFYIFFIGFYKWASLFSIVIFIVMASLVYFELTHHAGVDKRRYGLVKPTDGIIYGLIAVSPMIILQIIISSINYQSDVVNFAVLKANLIKGFTAPMLFISKLGGYQLPGYAAAWAILVILAFLGYYSGYKGFDLSEYFRRLFGLQPRKRPTTNKRRRFW